MSKNIRTSGQSASKGFCDQTNVALYYLLEALGFQNFLGVEIEGQNRKCDFTLLYSDHFESFEVKSHKKPLSFGEIHEIVKTQAGKSYKEKDKFKIVVAAIGPDLKKVYQHIHNYYGWITTNGVTQDPDCKALMRKSWTEGEIQFLSKTEIIEHGDLTHIRQNIFEFFVSKYAIYLSEADQESIVSKMFDAILEHGTLGKTISLAEVTQMLEGFVSHLVDVPTALDPKLSLGKRVYNFNDFFVNSAKLKELNRHTLLTQISADTRLSYFLFDSLEKNAFSVDEFLFLFGPILEKQVHLWHTLRLLQKKWGQKLVSPEFLLQFVSRNYARFGHEFNYDSALDLVCDIVKQDSSGKHDHEVLAFLKANVLRKVSGTWRERWHNKKKGWKSDKQVADIFKVLIARAKSDKVFVDLIFDYFDFTGDDFSLSSETHPEIYGFVKDYVKRSLSKNYSYVCGKLRIQFQRKFGAIYRGYELIGSGISQSGHNFSITDKGVVRFLWGPLFQDLYSANKSGAWKFFRRKILDLNPNGADINTPIYLKRALIPILIDRLVDDKLTRKEISDSFGYLKNILAVKNGIPNTSDIVFSVLRSKDFSVLGFDAVMALIRLDSTKYGQDGYPTNVFVMSSLIKLISLSYEPAKIFFLELIQKPDFAKYEHTHYNSFELLTSYKIIETDPQFIREVFRVMDLGDFFARADAYHLWDKGSLLAGLIKSEWAAGRKGSEYFDKLLIGQPVEKIQGFMSRCLDDLGEHDPQRTFSLILPYLKSREVFCKFFSDDNIRSSVVSLADRLIAKKVYTAAQQIIDLCAYDSDPDTDSKSEYNHHRDILLGKEENIITGVRARVCWSLQKIVVSNEPALMAYAFDKVKMMLDLDGRLAAKLGYSEPDLYIRLQAVIPLIELAHPWRRKALNKFKKGLGDNVKQIAFSILAITEKHYDQQKCNPKAIMDALVHVFFKIRDLNTKEAKTVVSFCVKHEIEKASGLIIYFAAYRKKHYKGIRFNPKYFDQTLEGLCKGNSFLKSHIAWELWKILSDDQEKGTNSFPAVEKYFEALFTQYERRTADYMYMALELLLDKKSTYSKGKKLLKKLLELEAAYFKTQDDNAQLWAAREVFDKLYAHSPEDFLEVFAVLVNNLDGKVHYYCVSDCIGLFKGLALKKRTPLIESLETKLKDLYPEHFLVQG